MRLHPCLDHVQALETSIEEQTPRRIVERFRGGLVFQAHRLLYHSTLGSLVIKKKKKIRNLNRDPKACWRSHSQGEVFANAWRVQNLNHLTEDPTPDHRHNPSLGDTLVYSREFNLTLSPSA